MIEVALTLDEARVIRNALKGSQRLLRDDSRHRNDLRRIAILIVRLEAEIKVEGMKK